jgi:hypothetical protein
MAIPVGTEIHFPRLPYCAPWGTHPLTKEVSSATDAWAEPFWVEALGDRARAKESSYSHGITYWMCVAFPFARDDRIYEIAKLAQATTLADDRFTQSALRDDLEGTRAAARRMYAALDGIPPEEGEGYSSEWMIYSACKSLHAGIPAELERRHLDTLRTVFATSVDEADSRLAGVSLEPDEYLKWRLTNVYGYQTCRLLEIAYDTDMSTALVEYPELAELCDEVIHHLVWTNDLYSFIKEARLGETTNLVLMLHARGSSLQEAVDEVARRLVAAERTFMAHWRELAHGPMAKDKRIIRYMNALAHLVGGNRHFSEHSRRFFGPGYDGTPVNGGTITIGAENCSFVPD